VSEPSHEPEGFLERGLGRLGRQIHRRAGLFVALIVLSLVPAGWLALQLEVRASFLDLLPDGEEPVTELRAVLGHVRATSDLVVAVPTTDRAQAERFGAALLEELEANPHIGGVGGHVDLAWFRDRRLLFADEAELERLRDRAHDAIDEEIGRRAYGLGLDDDEDAGGAETPSEMLDEVQATADVLGTEDWVVTTDGRYLCIWAFFSTPSGDLSAARASWDEVRHAVDGLRDGTRFPRDLEVHYAGGIPTQVEAERALREDLSVAGTIGFVGVVLLIVLALRTPRALILLSLPLFAGLVWTFAFAEVAVGHLNIISGFLFSILSGLGIEYGIHFMHRYRELREEGLALEPAIEKLVPSTGRALISGALTNAGVFAVIAAAQFRGFSDFGLIAAAGLILTLIVTVIGLPALLVLGERWRPMRFPKGESPEETVGVSVPAWVRWPIVIGVPLLAIASLAVLGTGGVRFDGNWRLLAGDTEVSRFGEYLRHHLGGTREAGALWVRDDAQLEPLRETIEALGAERQARGQAWDVVMIRTLDDVFPTAEHQARRAALAREIGEQLDRIHESWLETDAQRDQLAEARRMIAASQPFTLEQLPYSVVGHLLTSDGTGSIAHLNAPDSDDSGTGVLTSWAEQARDIARALREAHIDAPMLSENWVAGEIFERIARDARFLFIGTFASVFLILLIDFRRLGAALAVLGSVALGVVSIAGAMWATGLTLNFMNATILPVCVAISLDNAIHVYHRWREGGPGSIPIVLRQTTVANALSSATNLFGFGALVVTHHEGLRSVAYLAACGVGLTYLSTTVWFPLMLQTIDGWRMRRAKG
jgi:predicted RND superfamily exporter protein